MQQRPFGELGTASALTLGGGGIGQVWGPTTREECVATVREAVDSGIDVLDLAPSYGNGEAETVIGDAFNGSLPSGVRITTKCRVGRRSSGPGLRPPIGKPQRQPAAHEDSTMLTSCSCTTGSRSAARGPSARRPRRSSPKPSRRRSSGSPPRGASATGGSPASASRTPSSDCSRTAHGPTTSSASRTCSTPRADCGVSRVPLGRARSSQPPTPTAPPSWASAPYRPEP